MLNKQKFACCVWPDFALPLGKSGKDLVKYFNEQYDIDIEYLEAVKTTPGKGPQGGRIDQIFNIYGDDVDRFAEVKTEIGAVFATEIVRDKEHHYYNERVYNMYFRQIERKLIKTGELSESDKYPLKFD
ncbi:hypothetical protein JNUCC1_01464 [Lentibacillus sp. JNUCC-1]|uniref:hypothetical protein n=1 Tax=Lentibacillus sp. JNUCC-1 TaxID=2654513 RepID=UPI0012E8FAAF|nr:hypothetical protein [Lentibacillus sp. JNUCC-1]MUV37658.1 hypothetical protein [Lentibacillus sp. JNUCC-1]